MFTPSTWSLISIPAPARGRTWQPLRACLTVIDFNSRPREGANLFPSFFNPFLVDFNSRPREGANELQREHEHRVPHFNSRPREGANCLYCAFFHEQ